LSSSISDSVPREVGEVELLVPREGERYVRTEVRERGGGREADFHLTPLKAAEMFLASQVTNSSFSEVPRDTVTSGRRRRQRLSKEAS
jgi:hypothetical protein